MAKKSFGGTVYVRTDEMTQTLLAIQAKHGTAPNELTRKLLKSACDFYDQHGFFSFPVCIEPLAFQRAWIAAEEQAGYGQAPKKSPDPGRRPDKSQRRTGDGPAVRVSRSAKTQQVAGKRKTSADPQRKIA